MPIEPTIGLSDAALINAAKNVFGTELTTEELRELSAAIRAQSFFSAQTTDEHLLDLYQGKIGGILNPVAGEGEATTQFSPAYVRQAIKDFLFEAGYRPDEEQRGTLTDLSSNARINLVVKTNVEMAQGQGLWISNQRQALLDQFPAWELFRAETRVNVRDWLNRWRLAGGQTGDPMGTGWTITADSRMMALKNHPIWSFIGSSALFKDALDTPWPPFAFNSGMWVRDVSRKPAEAAGLIKPGQQIKPMTLAQAFKTIQAKAQEVAA